MPTTSTRPAAGLGLAVVSAATFGTSGTFGSSLISAGWSPVAAVTVRVTVAALVLTAPALLQLRGRWALLRRSLPAVLAFGLVAVAACQLCYFNAVAHLTVSVALLLEYSGILLVVAWLWVARAQRPRRLTASGGAVTLIGLVLVLNLTGGTHVDAVGLLWGLGAAVGLACYFVVSSRTEELLPPLVMAWAGMAVGSVALLAASSTGLVPVRVGNASVELAGRHMSWVVPAAGLSLVAAAAAYATGVAAVRHLGARLASFVGLTEVLFATLFAWVLLGQQPTLLQVLGGLSILVGIALVRADGTDVAAGGTPATSVAGAADDGPLVHPIEVAD